MAKKKLDPTADGVMAFDAMNAEQFNDAYAAWQQTAGDVEILARENVGTTVMIYWRKRRGVGFMVV